jgi:3-oxochol-4-en-24-oyl-CoA dehydrogenase
VSATISDEQAAARDLVRSWAPGSGAIAAVRAIEQGDVDAWQKPFRGLAELGFFGVAVPESRSGAGGSVADLCAMLDEAAHALVPGPVATTAVATLVLDQTADAHERQLGDLISGARSAGLALAGDLRYDAGRVSGTAPLVLGVKPGEFVIAPAGRQWLLVDTCGDGAAVEPLTPTDFSRPLARVVFDSAPAAVLDVSGQRVVDLNAAVLAAEAAGLARWMLETAADYAKVREQFGKPIGSFQAIKHMCAEMLLRSEQASVAAADAARAAADADADDRQFSIAAAVAAAIGIEAAKANAKDCIQVLGGIGITWEHDAHLYLRRAYGISQFLGGRSRWLRRVAALTREGVRRELHIDLESVDHLRPEIAAALAGVAALPVDKRQVALAEAGLLAPHWPKPYGRDASPAEQLLIDQQMAAAGIDRPDLVIGWWAAPTIVQHGSPEQIERFVPATLRGDLFWCQLFSEPGAGSDLASLRMKAVRAEGGWRLTGQKVWTSRASWAQWGVCLARTDPEAPKHKGITYFLVDMASPGILIRPLREITGDELFNEVFFDDVFVPDEMVVGAVNDGWRLARTTLANERVAMAQGTALGNPMEELLAAVANVELDPSDADRLGALIVSAQVGSLLDQRIAQLAVGGQDPGPQASARKLIGVRYRQGLSEFRMDLSDGSGIVDNKTVHDFLNTRCLTIAGGTEQILLTMAGERLLGLPR